MTYFSQHPRIRVVGILTNNPKAGVINRAAHQHVPCRVFSNADFASGIPVLKQLTDWNVNAIVLAGFLRKVSAPILEAFPDKIVNIHPALLPQYGGTGMYGHHVHEAVIAAKEEESGITIHVVNENYDEGRMLAQIAIGVEPDDTPDSLATRIHELEHKHYPVIVEHWLLNEPYLP